MDHILTTDNITKRYGGHDAVKSVNINIRQGDIYGLIGRNGAGKTTLLKMISEMCIRDSSISGPSLGGFLKMFSHL